MLIVFTIFIMVWLVQTQVVKTPKWARDWSGEPQSAKNEYAGALMTWVTVVFALFVVAGFVQMRRENVRV